MIDDPELRSLFRAESEEHLQTLENGLLRLEANASDHSVLDVLFRSAHSLKGAARMLGEERLETLAHHFEDELGAARRGHRPLTSSGADRLYQGLDAMRRLAQEACGGEEAHVDIPTTLAQIRGENTPPTVEDAVPTRATPIVEVEDPADGHEHPEVGFALPLRVATPPILLSPAIPEDAPSDPRPSTFKIETIRVEPHRLDALMTLAGEMAVTTSRAIRARQVIADLGELLDDWNRDAATQRTPTTGSDRLKRLGHLVETLERTGDEEISRLSTVADELVESIRDLRLLPLSTIFNLFPRTVRDLSHEQGKEVRLELEGGTVRADKHLLEALKDPLMHLIRNAIDHAVESPEERIAQGKPREATVRLSAHRTATRMIIEVSDDGRGLDEAAICETAIRKHLLDAETASKLSSDEVHRLVFTPGFSTTPLITDVSGRGVGLDVVRTNVEGIGGTITIDSSPGEGCTFRIEAPISLATTRVLLVQVESRSYAIPIDAVQETFMVSALNIFSIRGRRVARWDGVPAWVIPLFELLELPSAPQTRAAPPQSGVLLSLGSDRLGLFVDALLDEQEVIVKPFGGLLQRVRNVIGSTILSTGEICMVLNPHDLMKSMQNRLGDPVTADLVREPERKKSLLLAEDSITTRTQEKRILEGAGYEVVTAVDGADAFAKLSSRPFDAVVSDVEMPNMTGLQLAERIRQDPKYKEVPIILVTSLATDADRKRGVEVGANAYITKGTFDQKALLNTLRMLV